MALLNLRRGAREPQPRWLQFVIPALTVGGALVMAILSTEGLWPLGLVLLAAPPAFIILHRYPFAAIMLWLLVTPFLIATDGGILRRAYWVVHRFLPPLAIAVVALSAALRVHKRSLPRLLPGDLAAVGYVVACLLSILYLNEQTGTAIIYMYDHIAVPVCLYLLVRIIGPRERDLKWLLPVVIFTLLTQSAIGLLSWSAPGLLPDAWLGRAGLRTTGSLVSYSVFSAAVAFCGLYLLHAANSLQWSRKVHHFLVLLFLLAGFMIFFSFSRGSWLAGLIILSGLFLIHRRSMIQIAMVALPLLLLLFGTGLLADEAEFARQRFFSEQSEESALSRLPVVYASLRMFQEKPLFGWGYENFDKFDYQFQRRVGNLINPDKDHASHNVYLTILAEQGMLGLILFLTPMFAALVMTLKAWPHFPVEGFINRELLFSLWLVIVFHVVVNNFSNMRIEYGQGMWWLTLGLIVSLTAGSNHSKGSDDA